MNNRKIVTVTGPSLSGKSTLVGNLMSRDPRVREMISTTTRPIREGEIHGRNYYYVAEDDFNMIPMIETTRVSGFQYGMSAAEAEKVFASGSLPIIVVDPFGARQISDYAKAHGLQHLAIFVNAPRLVRFERFIGRVLADKNAQVEVYAKRLESIVDLEEAWYSMGDWHLTVYQYDASTQEKVDSRILQMLFGATAG